MAEYLEIPTDFYGDAFERVMKETEATEARDEIQIQKPRMKDFNIPESQLKWDQMILKMNECGIKTLNAIEMITARQAEFDEACKKSKN